MFNLVTPVYSLVQSSILVIFCHGENRNDGHWSPNTHSIIQLEKISNNFVCLFVRGCWLWAMEVNVLPFPILSLPNPSFFSLPCLWYSIPEKNRKNKHYSISIYFCFLSNPNNALLQSQSIQSRVLQFLGISKNGGEILWLPFLQINTNITHSLQL